MKTKPTITKAELRDVQDWLHESAMKLKAAQGAKEDANDRTRNFDYRYRLLRKLTAIAEGSIS